MIGRTTDRRGDQYLLGLIAIGMVILLGMIITKGGDGWDVAAFLLVLQQIISTIKEGRSAATIDKQSDQLAGSAPTPQFTDENPMPTKVMNALADPVPVEPLS